MTEKKRIVFVHGWATDPWVWERAADHFKRLGNGVVNLALPSHGGRERWESPDPAPALMALERAAGGRPFVGVGWSLGASVLLAYAAKRPDMVEGLVLVGATARFTAAPDGAPPAGQSRALVRRMIGDVKKDTPAALKRFYSLNFTEAEAIKKEATDFLKRYEYPGPMDCELKPGRPPGCYPLLDYGGIASALDALNGLDLCAALGGVQATTLLVHGSLDAVVPVGAAVYLKENLKRSALELFDGAGHAPFLTEEGRFVERLKVFLDGLK